MSLRLRLTEDMKAALKAGSAGKLKLSTIRLVLAAVKNAEIERRRELDDPDIMEVIIKEVKQRQDALAEFQRGGRQDLVEQGNAEIAVLRTYLPAPLDEAELRRLVRDAIAEVGASGPRDMGKVMPVLLPRIKGRADNKLVSQLVREMLG